MNSGLHDVEALVQAVEHNHGDFKAAVEEYSKERLPEAEALVKLHQFGFPWQYGLPDWRV